MPPDAPSINVPSFAKETALATDDPLPVSATFATVLPTVNAVTSTSAESVAVPPTSAKVKVVTPLMLPLAVMSVFATLFPVESVKVLLPPVTTPMVKSPVVLLALVSSVTLLPKVIAPNTIASFELLIDVFKVTVPATLLVVRPPLKVKLSPVELPKVNVPSLAKLAAPLKVLVLPVKIILATVLLAESVAVLTLPGKVTVPPILLSVRASMPLLGVESNNDIIMSAPDILLPVDRVSELLLPVIAPTKISAN